MRFLDVEVGDGVQFFGLPILTKFKDSKIKLGNNCVICSRSDSTDLGINHPVMLRTLRPGAEILIGSHTGISGGAICAAIRVEIGRECLIGANVIIVDTDFHPINPKFRRYNNVSNQIHSSPIIIEDNVFIGTSAIILKGVKVGRNSVIGAGAVVTKSVPANSVVVGNPARVVNSL